MSDCFIISLYPDCISQSMIDYQKKVFDNLDIPITQIKVDGRLAAETHAHAMGEIVKSYKYDYYIFFDIDAIPLKKELVNYILHSIRDDETLFGVAQQSNHIIKPNGTYDHIYAGPSCMGFSSKLYSKLGSPSFAPNHRGDTAEELTWETESKELKLKLLYPTHSVGKPIWDLGHLPPYGFGTTYDDMVFHCFGATGNNGVTKGYNILEMFVEKCKEVLGE